jgi:hypothetical protein
VEPERKEERSDSTNKVIKDLLPFLDKRAGEGAPANYHCSIDSGCKSFAFVEIKEGSSVIDNYTQLAVPNSNYLPNDFVVERGGHNNPYVLTRPFELMYPPFTEDDEDVKWQGIVIHSNGPFQLPLYNDTMVNEAIGVSQGDLDFDFDSMNTQLPDSPQKDLVDPVAAAAEAAAVVANQVKEAEAGAAAGAAVEAVEAGAAEAAATGVSHIPSLIIKTMGYVARMINYFFASPKIGRSKYDEKFIDGLIQNLHLDFYRDISTPSTPPIQIEKSRFPRVISSFGGRGCKLLKRTKKQKRGSRRRGSRRGSRRGRKN